MNTKLSFEHFESFLTLLFAVSVFVWKPGMYVASGAITLYLMVRCAIQPDYRHMVWNNRITKVSLAIFLLGLITASIGAEQFQDITWMARKTLFLPAVVFFVFALSRQLNRNIAMAGLITGFWIASVLTLNEYQWQLNFGDRMQGPWPQGTWDSLLGLFFAFMVLSFKWTGASNAQRVIHLGTTALALLMLVLAGGRAPWIGALLSLAIYFVFFKPNKKLVLFGLITGVIASTLVLTTLEQKAQPVIERFASVFNTTTNSSNWIRLQLWQIGIAHLNQLAKDDPVEFIVGGGAQSYDAKQVAFFETMPYNDADRSRLTGYGYPTGDTHNTYIDNALRHGVLWTLAMTIYLIWLCTRFSWHIINSNPTPSILLMNLLIVGMFYTVVPHFVTLFFVLFWAMLQMSQPHPADRRAT
ncbi:O-antigen ligase family protein [Orrella daihaiensis]|uniref:O-antigen ligase family protein n=1 Tax=Orrella daihaiensis TaxID=2782176 RepID=A0ABY4AMT9_9BURK|nr:O-antigen ligase family protein [Orrella daihaiensis]UOD51489.1 O-antigen ligase family protein [Orrella daihaiensis]